MKSRASVLAVVCLVATVCGVARSESDAKENCPWGRNSAKELYWIMRRDGVIAEEEYERALRTGSISDPSQKAPMSVRSRHTGTRRAVTTGGDARIWTIMGDALPTRQLPAVGDRIRTRRRPASRAYTNVVVGLRERVRQRAVEDDVRASRRRHRARAWAQAHGMPYRQMSPDGDASGIHHIDARGIPQVLAGDDLYEAQVIKADELWPTATNGYALSGSNVIVALWDTGQIRTTHDEFEGRATQVHTNAGFVVTDHATGMAGVIAAGGVSTGYDTDGIVYAANVNGYDYERADVKWDDVAAEGKLISNHPYSYHRGWDFNQSLQIWMRYVSPSIDTNEDYAFGHYDDYTRRHDDDIYEMKYTLPVWSVGNDRGEGPATQPTNWVYAYNPYVTNTTTHPLDGAVDSGYDTIPFMKTAKNALVIGAADVVSRDQYSIMSESAWGPTDDGRLVPHVVAPGYSVVAPKGTSDSDLSIYNGSSPASAVGAGVVAQLVQLDQQLNGTNEPLWASTYKALVVHTSEKDSYYSVGPDYQQGYGLINARRAADLLKTDSLYSSPQHVFEVVVATNQSIHAVVYSDGTAPLVATLCWSDPAGPEQPDALDATNRVLVHDLDLRISGPYDTVVGGSTGTVYYPWVLDPANPSSVATTNDNVLDNLEQVCVTNQQAGCYSIHLTMKPCMSSGCSPHEQEASLIVSGNEPMEILPEITLASRDTNGVCHLTWVSNAGVTEYVSSSTNLLVTNGWSELSDETNIIQPLNEWADTINTNATDVRRFYRIERYR